MGQGDLILREADKNPNTRGAAGVCGAVPPAPMQDLAAAVQMGRYSGILALGSETKDLADAASLKNAGLSVVFATHEGPHVKAATVVLPVSSWAEYTGTTTNAKGITQESEQAIGPIGSSRPAWKLFAALAVRLGQDFGWRKLSDVRDAMARGSASVPPHGPRAVGASS
jgi:NADH dehydrogenase/NADH:ubiquinone oxidoreductase subunit G